MPPPGHWTEFFQAPCSPKVQFSEDNVQDHPTLKTGFEIVPEYTGNPRGGVIPLFKAQVPKNSAVTTDFEPSMFLNVGQFT